MQWGYSRFFLQVNPKFNFRPEKWFEIDNVKSHKMIYSKLWYLWREVGPVTDPLPKDLYIRYFELFCYWHCKCSRAFLVFPKSFFGFFFFVCFWPGYSWSLWGEGKGGKDFTWNASNSSKSLNTGHDLKADCVMEYKCASRHQMSNEINEKVICPTELSW